MRNAHVRIEVTRYWARFHFNCCNNNAPNIVIFVTLTEWPLANRFPERNQLYRPTIIFGTQQHNAIARYMLSVCLFVCPSVCPSVTRVDQSKTAEVTMMQLSSQSSPVTLVSSLLTSPQNSKGKIRSGDAKWRRGGKIRNFQQISRRISETVQDRTKVTINDQ